MKKIIIILLISSLFYSCVALRFPDKMEININVPEDFDIEKLEIIVDTLRSQAKNKFDMQVIEEVSFPDHHFYTDRQLADIFKIADKNNALVVTTEKDYVKLSKSFKKKIYPIKIELHLSKSEKLLMGLKSLVF